MTIVEHSLTLLWQQSYNWQIILLIANKLIAMLSQRISTSVPRMTNMILVGGTQEVRLG
jgi:hypothetical protein